MSEAADDLAPAMAELAVLLSRIAARLATTRAPHENGGGDHLLTADDAATMLAVTKDWLRRRELPFAVKLSEGVVRYSARGIERYIAARVGR